MLGATPPALHLRQARHRRAPGDRVSRPWGGSGQVRPQMPGDLPVALGPLRFRQNYCPCCAPDIVKVAPAEQNVTPPSTHSPNRRTSAMLCRVQEEQLMAQSSAPIEVYLEIGKKRTFAGALDWPGWCRGGRDEPSALQALLADGPRYARVLDATG